jgi:D-arabinose 1-dehydrogenase-like Zn-dependent alcohol dehydrogenase
VLIFGASGAVGTLAIQFAKRLGARVLATASGRDAARWFAGSVRVPQLMRVAAARAIGFASLRQTALTARTSGKGAHSAESFFEHVADGNAVNDLSQS